MDRRPSIARFILFTTWFAVRYWTCGSWVRVKWHYLRWRKKKYYL